MHYKFRSILIAFICLHSLSACVCSRENGSTEIIGHRGLADLAPENTITGLDSAIANKMLFTEIDVRRTNDGVVILMHDKNLDRTTNGSGDIKDTDYSVIKELNITHDFIHISNQLRVPTLDSVLNYIMNEDINLIIELKDPQQYPGIENQVINLIEKYDLTRRVVVASFDQQSLKQIACINSDIKIGLLTFFKTKTELKKLEFIGLHWLTAYLTPWKIKDLKKRKIPVWVWTVNSAKIACQLSNQGINGIITDTPALLNN